MPLSENANAENGALRVRSLTSLLGLLHKNRTEREGEGVVGRRVARTHHLVYGVSDAVEDNSGKRASSRRKRRPELRGLLELKAPRGLFQCRAWFGLREDPHAGTFRSTGKGPEKVCTEGLCKPV